MHLQVLPFANKGLPFEGDRCASCTCRCCRSQTRAFLSKGTVVHHALAGVAVRKQGPSFRRGPLCIMHLQVLPFANKGLPFEGDRCASCTCRCCRSPTRA